MKIYPLGAAVFHAKGRTDGRAGGQTQTDRHDKGILRIRLKSY